MPITDLEGYFKALDQDTISSRGIKIPVDGEIPEELRNKPPTYVIEIASASRVYLNFKVPCKMYVKRQDKGAGTFVIDCQRGERSGVNTNDETVGTQEVEGPFKEIDKAMLLLDGDYILIVADEGNTLSRTRFGTVLFKLETWPIIFEDPSKEIIEKGNHVDNETVIDVRKHETVSFKFRVSCEVTMKNQEGESTVEKKPDERMSVTHKNKEDFVLINRKPIDSVCASIRLRVASTEGGGMLWY